MSLFHSRAAFDYDPVYNSECNTMNTDPFTSTRLSDFAIYVRTHKTWNRVHTMFSQSNQLSALNMCHTLHTFTDGQRVMVRNVRTDEIFEFTASVPQRITFTQV